MRATRRWKLIVLAAVLCPLLGTSCGMEFRDAVKAGAFDFVSGTVAELLQSVFPITEAVQPD